MLAFMRQDRRQNSPRSRMAFPRREVFGVKAGGGTAPAEQGERQGRQQKQKREASRTQWERGRHGSIIPNKSA